MNTMSNIQDSLGKSWHSITEGWQHFYQRCKGALTHFVNEDENRDKRRLSWGLLSTDLADNGNELVVTMEVPGMDKGDIHVQVDGELLTVSGTKRFAGERQQGDYHIMECAYGSFERSLRLPVKIDHDKVDASYKNGVLRLKMAKLVTTKKIAIDVK